VFVPGNHRIVWVGKILFTPESHTTAAAHWEQAANPGKSSD